MKPPFYAAVADGVSGETSGDVASKTALEVLSVNKPHARTDYEGTALSVHRYLKMIGSQKDLRNMQTTLCACAFLPGKASGYLINIGDSRAYLYRGGSLKQLSKDQSLAQLLFDTGQLSKEQKAAFAHKNVILPALGNLAEDPVPDIQKLPLLLTGDIILLCTDGLSDFVPADAIEYILSLPERLQGRVKKLCDRALMSGCKDNITVMVIQVSE
jgi:protein phosphatase